MDQFTRRIIGFGVHAGYVDGIALCRMFNKVIARTGVPKYLSTYHRWLANLRILEIDELKTVPYTPISHPFVERLIGSLGANFSTKFSFGTPLTWRESYGVSNSIIIIPEHTHR